MDPCLYIEQAIADGISMYPNPSDGEFTVRVDQPGSYAVQVYNCLGQLVLNMEMNLDQSLNGSIDMGDHEPGLYLVRLRSDQINVVQKIRLVNE